MGRKNVDFEYDNKTFRVYEPTLEDQKEANKVRNSAFTDAVNSNALLRDQLEQVLKDREIWGKRQTEQFDKVTKKINDGELRLKQGGIPLKEAKKLAVDMRQLRQERQQLLSKMADLDNNTAEGQADNMAFNYLISACLVYNNNGKEEKYYEDVSDYLNRSTEPVAILAANKLASIMHSVGEDVDKTLPENEFLLNFDFVDDKLRLVDEKGRLIDEDDKLINEVGQYIDEDGNIIDEDGHSLDDDGNFKVENKGFFDENGKVVFGKDKTDSGNSPDSVTKEEQLE